MTSDKSKILKIIERVANHVKVTSSVGIIYVGFYYNIVTVLLLVLINASS